MIQLSWALLTRDELLKSLYHGLMLTIILLHRRLVLLSHSVDLLLDLRLLEQFIDLQIHLLKAPDQVEVRLFESDQALLLPLNLDDPLLFPPLELNLSHMQARVVYLRDLNFDYLRWRQSC